MSEFFIQNIVAHAVDSNIRSSASSGGFCKSFLLYLLDYKIIDNVILTRLKDNSTQPESIITCDKNKILTRTNSIYEYHNQIKILSEIKNDQKYAFIGLPCFIKYIRNQQLEHNKYLNIFPLISILCNQAPNSLFKYQLCKDYNININDVIEINYRYGKYPGSVYIKMIDGSFYILDSFPKIWAKYNDPGFEYAPQCCLNCELFESTFADIVVGDPWKTIYTKDSKGWTKVIIRNEHSMSLILDATNNGYLSIKHLKNSETFLAYKHTKEYKNNNESRL
jgi:coenzyme F420 hydrogenase subunit beta